MVRVGWDDLFYPSPLLFIENFLTNMKNLADGEIETLDYANILDFIGKQLKDNGLHEEAEEKFNTAAALRTKITKELEDE
jgi:hypothetical protein